jgi:hypothetical protein
VIESRPLPAGTLINAAGHLCVAGDRPMDLKSVIAQFRTLEMAMRWFISKHSASPSPRLGNRGAVAPRVSSATPHVRLGVSVDWNVTSVLAGTIRLSSAQNVTYRPAPGHRNAAVVGRMGPEWLEIRRSGKNTSLQQTLREKCQK